MLSGQYIRLAALTSNDVPQLLEWHNTIALKRLTGPGAFIPAVSDTISIANSSTTVQFGIRRIDGAHLVGYVSLTNITWSNRVADLGVYVGDNEDRGKGIGREAVSLVLKYAFHELNLHRVQLDVVDYNTRAIALYNQLGFTHEGTRRQHGWRDGQPYNVLVYGILATDWQDTKPDGTNDHSPAESSSL